MPPWILLIRAVPIVIGLYVIKRGLQPKRVGNTPHCPACDYILSGDQSRCPECGMPVDLSNVVRGDPRRRRLLLGIGAAMTLAGLALFLNLTPALINSIGWRKHMPLSWLLRELDNNSSPAWLEIQRRLDANLLSESDQNAVVERGLRVQNVRSTNVAEKNVLDFVGKRYFDHKLTPDQADRFFTNMEKPTLSVRPTVGSLSHVPFSVTSVGHGPFKDWWYRLEVLESRIDDGPLNQTTLVARTRPRPGFGSFGGTFIEGMLAPIRIPGRHRLRLKIEMSAGTTDGFLGADWESHAVIARRLTEDLYATFEVIEGQTPIATVAAPDAAAMRSLLTPQLTFSPRANPSLHFTVYPKALPVDIAFLVFVRIKGIEYPMGEVYFHNSSAVTALDSHSTGTNKLPPELPSNADVILRSSEAVARHAAGITRIWKGEIIFQNLPIERVEP